MPPKLSLPDVLYALSDPIRLQIVQQLASEGDTACGTFDIRMPKSSLSHHFKVLRDAGVIGTVSEGVRRINTLRRDEIDSEFPGLMSAVLSQPVKRGSRKAPASKRPSRATK
jgi:DNA-binding transcriptional ArsR family regulator